MGIQLTNPNILDLTEWQKVINEINNLSDRIDGITTVQGSLMTAATDWNSSTNFSQQFNMGNQKILFGKEKATIADLTQTGNLYSGAIVFAETDGVGAFGAKPIITASIVFGNQSVPEPNDDVALVLFNASSTGFGYRVTSAGSNTKVLTGYFYINWIAIGPQG